MSYKKSGVDTNAADVWVEGIQAKLGASDQLVNGVGEYAAVYKLNDREWVATSCDGIGTKILWSLGGLGSPKDLAQDLVAMNVNDVLCTGATPKLFMDYLACSGKEALRSDGFLKKFINGLIEVCGENEQILAGGETAQMPDLYDGDDFDAAGFSVGFMSPDQYLDPKKLTSGLEVWGLPSSGPHSNGFTWLRKLFDSKSESALIAELFMKPTRIYVKDFLRLRESVKILSAYHVTGSGLLNLLRSQSKVGFKLTEWPTQLPDWVEIVKNKSGSTLEELFTTFNCGFGFIVVVEKSEMNSSYLERQGFQKLGVTSDKYEVSLPQFKISFS